MDVDRMQQLLVEHVATIEETERKLETVKHQLQGLK
jgi:hypothetical protein